MMKFSDGTIYDGDYMNGKWTGKGYYVFNGGEYQGDFIDGK